MGTTTIKSKTEKKPAKLVKPKKGSFEAIVAAAIFARKKGLENYAR